MAEQTTAGSAVHMPDGAGDQMWVLGDLYTFKVGSEETGGAFAVFETVSPAGNAGPPPHVHTDGDESFYVLEGTLELWANGETVLAGPGSFTTIPRGVPHTFRNAGDTAARFLVTLTPAGFERFFREVGEPATDPSTPPTTPPDVERIIATAAKYNCEFLPPPDAE